MIIRKVASNMLEKCGKMVATSAFAFAKIAANTSCAFPYYEPEEPTDLKKLKKFDK